MGSYTIGEVAGRSGFTASALRYYEGIGLVEPTDRTAAGYRLYDDDSLARLAFIARAKQLGCTLEEITDLVGIWEGEGCGRVQRRFHDLVTDKLTETQRQIAELTALADQLRHAAERLGGPASDGPCDERCACLAPGGTSDARAGADDTAVPIACTAGEGLGARKEQIARLRDFGPVVERSAGGMLLHFVAGAAVAQEVADFVLAEKACCAFWSFDVTTSEGCVTLRWDGPPEVAAIVDALAAFLAGAATLDALDGLL